jgi:hypothetical protein
MFGATNPAAQYREPESGHLCGGCTVELRRFKEGFGVTPTERKAEV